MGFGAVILTWQRMCLVSRQPTVVLEVGRGLQWKYWQRWACEPGLVAGFEEQQGLRIGVLCDQMLSGQLEGR
jgi:hypothetical protein